MIAAGIDIGGTKIEVQLFDEQWRQVAAQRVETPTDYDALVRTVADQVAWGDAQAGYAVPVGIGAAGLIHPDTGLALTANLCATGKPFPADINAAVGRHILYLNDCRAMAVSEAAFGAGQGYRAVMSLIIGTGVGGGLVTDHALHPGSTHLGGEFGHIAAPAHLVAADDLPIRTCGCGRPGCIETFIAGPGLERMTQHLLGQSMTVPQIAADRHGTFRTVWTLWCALVGELVHTLTLISDPDLIVLGGGLSKIDGVAEDISKAAQAAQLGGFGTPPLVLAAGGDASGARGAAYVAWQDAQTKRVAANG